MKHRLLELLVCPNLGLDPALFATEIVTGLLLNRGRKIFYPVDPAYKHFGRNSFLHLVQPSVFAPPFVESTFDLVYSWGVLHHTFSTKAAFHKICKLPKPGGRLYVWVYSHYDEERTFKRRILMSIERLVRPIVWRLPAKLQTVALLPMIPLYLAHQNLLCRYEQPGLATYRWREALHAARDRFIPRYAHRHTEEEVRGWFSEAGYVDIRSADQLNRPDFVPVSFVVANGIDGIRSHV